MDFGSGADSGTGGWVDRVGAVDASTPEAWIRFGASNVPSGSVLTNPAPVKS